jgi:hypothetical protein
MPRTDLKPPVGTPSRQRPGLSFSRDFGTTQVTVASPGGAASVAPERTLLRTRLPDRSEGRQRLRQGSHRCCPFSLRTRSGDGTNCSPLAGELDLQVQSGRLPSRACDVARDCAGNDLPPARIKGEVAHSLDGHQR